MSVPNPTLDIVTPSSEGLTRLLTGIDPGTMQRFDLVSPVSFEWATTGEYDYGLITEEVDQIMPELVKRDASGSLVGVKYLSFIALLIRKCQLLEKRINELEKIKNDGYH